MIFHIILWSNKIKMVKLFTHVSMNTILYLILIEKKSIFYFVICNLNVTYLQYACEFNETDELQILQSHTIDWILRNHITYKIHLYYPPRFKALNSDGLQFIFVWMCLWWFLKRSRPIQNCYVHYHSWISAINMSMLPKTYWIICNWKFDSRINFPLSLCD